MGRSICSLAAALVCVCSPAQSSNMRQLNEKDVTLLLQSPNIATGAQSHTTEPTITAPPDPSDTPKHPKFQNKIAGYIAVGLNLVSLLFEYYERAFVQSACLAWRNFGNAAKNPTADGNWKIIGLRLSQVGFYWVMGIVYYMVQDGFSFATSVHVLGQQLSTVGFGDSKEIPHLESLQSRIFGGISALASKLLASEAIIKPLYHLGPMAAWLSLGLGYVLLICDKLEGLKKNGSEELVQITYLYLMAITSIGLGDITPDHEWAKILLGMLYPWMAESYNLLVGFVNKGPMRKHYTVMDMGEETCPEDEYTNPDPYAEESDAA